MRPFRPRRAWARRMAAGAGLALTVAAAAWGAGLFGFATTIPTAAMSRPARPVSARESRRGMTRVMAVSILKF